MFIPFKTYTVRSTITWGGYDFDSVVCLLTLANKRQTTVTINQILTQKWFLLQNIKDSSLSSYVQILRGFFDLNNC
jgi:hypothetical protein